MNRWLLLVVIVIGLSLLGCSAEDVSGDKPPQVFIKIGKEKYQTILGTYCWGSTCVDTAGPVELLAGKEPISVKPSEVISLEMNYEPKPNEVYVVQMSESGEKEITVQDNQFTAPSEKGIYYYSYGVWWMDEKEENVSHGDAFYAFALEVVP